MIKVHPEGGIYKLNFGYNPKMEGYTTLMSDIPKLYAIAGDGLGIIGREYDVII